MKIFKKNKKVLESGKNSSKLKKKNQETIMEKIYRVEFIIIQIYKDKKYGK